MNAPVSRLIQADDRAPYALALLNFVGAVGLVTSLPCDALGEVDCVFGLDLLQSQKRLEFSQGHRCLRSLGLPDEPRLMAGILRHMPMDVSTERCAEELWHDRVRLVDAYARIVGRIRTATGRTALGDSDVAVRVNAPSHVRKESLHSLNLIHIGSMCKQWGGRTPKAGGRELDGRTWDEFPNTPTPDSEGS